MVTANSGVLGNTTGGTVVENGATLGLSGGITYDAGELLTISGTGIVSTEFFFPGSINQRGALQSVSGDNTWQGNVTITGPGTRIGVQDGARLTLTGTITDGGTGQTLIFRGGTGAPGMITISGSGNSWGRTDIYGSSTRIGADNALPTTAPLYVGAANVGDSIFDLNGFDQTVPGIAHVGGAVESNIITNNGSADSVLTLNGSQDLSFTGTLRDGPTHKLSLVKAGSFTQTFSGPATYTGSTDITAGTLAVSVSGSISGSTAINISGGANFNVNAIPGGFTLGSTQTITGGEGINAGSITGRLVASAGSTVAPGLGAGDKGTLSISNGFSLNSDAHLSLDIGGVTAGTGYDQLFVGGGNISLSGDLAGSTLTFEPTNYQDVFFIIVNNGTGTTSGTLNGIGEGGSIFISGQEFQISYTSDFATGFTVGGSGNDVALLAVPEPSAVVSILSGVGMLLGFRRRRRA